MTKTNIIKIYLPGQGIGLTFLAKRSSYNSLLFSFLFRFSICHRFRDMSVTHDWQESALSRQDHAYTPHHILSTIMKRALLVRSIN